MPWRGHGWPSVLAGCRSSLTRSSGGLPVRATDVHSTRSSPRPPVPPILTDCGTPHSWLSSPTRSSPRGTPTAHGCTLLWRPTPLRDRRLLAPLLPPIRQRREAPPVCVPAKPSRWPVAARWLLMWTLCGYDRLRGVVNGVEPVVSDTCTTAKKGSRTI